MAKSVQGLKAMHMHNDERAAAEHLKLCKLQYLPSSCWVKLHYGGNNNNLVKYIHSAMRAYSLQRRLLDDVLPTGSNWDQILSRQN